MILTKYFSSMVVSLPSSKSLSLNWNYGSMLGMVLFFQIVTGTLLVFYYTPDGLTAFSSVQYLMFEVNYGWVFRVGHFNGASLFFVFLYLHFFKGLFFGSYRLTFVWASGLTIFLLVMGEAFMGYVLVWAQMSYWAAVVISSLLTVIPFWGGDIVTWVWGGFTVCSATLKFFFVIHFLLPWGLLVLVLLHLIFLHESGSSSVLYCHGDYDKISFFPEYWFKDALNLLVWWIFMIFIFSKPFDLGDPEMFIEANPLVSPKHIVPEWYFLFAYAILRAIPDKTLGVLALLFSILVFYFFVIMKNYYMFFDISNFFLVSSFAIVGCMLSWLGQCPVEPPFSFLSVLFSVLYFFNVSLIFLNYCASKFLLS